MFNRDALFNKKDESARPPVKQVNLTPGLTPSPSLTTRPPEPSKADEAASPAPAAITTPAGEVRGSRLIVGPDIKLKGVEITDCDTLVVEGRVEASMDSRVIQIAEAGVFSGTVGIDIAEIRGRFEGELTARQQLVIRSTGKVTGKIRYGKITIEEGGELVGDVSTLAGPASVRHAEAVVIPEPANADIMTAYDPFARKAKPMAKSGGL
jgi:cytoskeletal protein CcmA (bactofilin family)